MVLHHQTQAFIKILTSVGHSVVDEYDTAVIQVRRDESSEKQRQRRNANCAHRTLRRTLRKVNMGRSVTLFYKKKRAEVKTAFTHVFTANGHAEFDLEYGVHAEKMPPINTTA